MYQNYIKRSFDLIGAITLFALALPLFIIIAIIIKLTSNGPVIFTQDRSGVGGKVFKMRKFRTMAHDNDVHDASRENHITGVGKILRAFSLDELPQLINVIRGDMSFIGPRPWITPYYDHMNDTQRRRYAVRPGITGLAQVYGRNNLTIHQKIGYDLRYVEHIGLREDLKVVFLTFTAVLSKEGEAIGKGGIHEELDILKRQFKKHENAENAANYSDSKSREPAI